ncbi:MAG: glycosyltransferase [Gemmatimonadota bacterium]
MTTIVVSGALANKPRNGGEAWVRMTWVAGLRRLGFDVWFVEQISRDLLDQDATTDNTPGNAPHLAFFQEVAKRFGLEDRCSLVDENGACIAGRSLKDLAEVASEAALLVNISGNLSLEPLFDRFRCKAFIDLDPGFTQFWHAAATNGARLSGHDHYFTVGLNVGRASSPVPTCGIHWHPLAPPVLLSEWPICEGDRETLTTIASWRGSFGAIEHEGRTYGLKVHEFRRFIDLPERVPQRLEIALDIHPADNTDLNALRDRGWNIVDPRRAVPDPDAYRRYIQGSGAEFSVAQGIYVETHSGWFSDRTVQYLASGKPTLVQETGFSRTLPSGEGLVGFRTFEEAVAGARSIASDYELHNRAARCIAEEYFDSDKVLGHFLEEVEVAA